MKTYKVYTKWIGYSEIIVDAKDEQEAKDFSSMGFYKKELLTGKGLDYGYEDENLYKVEEVDDENLD
jgi:hypothetical protein